LKEEVGGIFHIFHGKVDKTSGPMRAICGWFTLAYYTPSPRVSPFVYVYKYKNINIAMMIPPFAYKDYI